MAPCGMTKESKSDQSKYSKEKWRLELTSIEQQTCYLVAGFLKLLQRRPHTDRE